MIPDTDLEVLESFNGHGSILLSAYLRLDTPEFRESAHSEFMQQIQVRLDECGRSHECREALREDMEIVSLYLRTNGHRDYIGLAIFSCAAELFWRVYPLPSPVPNRVSVGSAFDVAPLGQAVRRGTPA